MKVTEIIVEEKVRLDPKCWTGKKIGNPKTKVKGGVRVNNCVPAESVEEAANAAQQAAIAISMKKAGKKPKNESVELEEEFDLIESIIERLAQHNGVDAEVIWEDLETLTEDELYAFAVTSEPIMESQGVAEGLEIKIPTEDGITMQDIRLMAGEGKLTKKTVLQAIAVIRKQRRPKDVAESYDNEELANEVYAEFERIYPNLARRANERTVHAAIMDVLNYGGDSNPSALAQDVARAVKRDMQQGVAEDWQKANKRDKTDGMSQKAVNAYRRENPGSKLKTAVTTKPGKLKKGGKASKRRKSYCSRSRGQMKMHSISCAKTPDKAICKARRRWNC